MARLLSVSRAARLVGTTRGILQKRIQDGELTSFEGKVSLSELNQLYPQARFEDRAMLDRVEEIIERSRFKARSRTPFPSDKESLLARAAILADELALAKLDLSNFAIFIQKLKTRLKTLDANADPATRDVLQQLTAWIEVELPAPAEPSPQQQLLVQDTMLRLITAQIQLLPSGHEYLLEGNTTLLEAGLSAGFALNYGCSNGNCGNCKARLVSGQVKKTRPHDYVFSEAEKAQHYILMCCNTALTDVVLEADEADEAKDIPLQNITAKVKKVVPAGEDISILNLKTPRTNRLRFLAGQQVQLHINDSLGRQLPIASCPCDDMNIQFHIPARGDNPFDKYVLQQLKSGDEIGIEGPQGDFVLDDDASNPLIFIALDTGFAPIKSLVEHAITLAHAEQVYLYWIASADHTHYLRNQCRAWADAFDSLQYTELSMQAAGDSAAGRQALAELLSGINSRHTDLPNSHVYVAGNKAFIQQCREHFEALAVARLMSEAVE